MSTNKFIDSGIEVKEADDTSRTITAIGSKEIVDRDGDIVKLDGMSLKEYKKNPVVLWSHDYRDLPVGKAVGKMVWLDDDTLKFKIQFATAEENPKAEYVYKLFKNGFLKSFSIGFMPDFESIEYKEDKKTNKQVRVINKAELFEISAVNVPSNSAALIQTFEKAWDAGILDGSELDELHKMCNIVPKVVNPEIAVLKARIAELELQLIDKEVEEVVEEDIYSELFAAFDNEKTEVKEDDKDLLDELL